MISYLKWKIIELDFWNLTILTQSWVWYEVFINELIYSRLSIQEEAELYVYHHRTENSQNLFWFNEPLEKKIFTELIKISGVWWKVAMLILWLWINRLIEAISYEDKKTIESIKWIWKKMAEKIVLELKDKDFGVTISSWKDIVENNVKAINRELFTSIKDTLVNMWYTLKDVEKILSELPDWMEDAWEIIPYIIKELS